MDDHPVSSDEANATIRVEVVLATPARQELVSLRIAAGSTLGDAVEQSGILDLFDNFEVDAGRVGIFGHRAGMDQVLREGDRVEIYRPLIADPKEVRRQKALKQAGSRRSGPDAGPG